MIVFERPGFLILLLLLPLLFYCAHFWKKRGNRIPFPFRVWGGSGFKPQTRRIYLLRFVRHLFFWGSFGAILIAFAGPVRTEKEKLFLTKGADIMIVLDQSPSMAARDFPPTNRFESARGVIKSFLKARENDAIGLVSFGKEAVLRVPPTRDYDMFLKQLDSLKIMGLGDGSSVGMGIALAALHLEHTSSEEKIIILLTDGANNSGEIQPETAGEISGRLGIRIYCVGMGAPGLVQARFNHPETGQEIEGTVRESYDEDLLKRLSGITGGEFFKAPSPGTLEAVFQSIDSVETIEKRVKTKVVKFSLHRQFILASFFLLLISQIWSVFVLREIL